ncbi:SpoIIE family protein phosphatase [Streptomyces lucensis]|uniref:SpoIIE family protein phosphatase n=1 Tax=Streptomyces lucensis TaxID=67319 RepID=UPI0027E5BB23|nr:SpoIIE family protein phosphatase [Streptomyces lucensis]
MAAFHDELVVDRCIAPGMQDAVLLVHCRVLSPCRQTAREAPFESEQVTLPLGNTLVLYTDGLIESHEHDVDHGMHLLAHALRGPSQTLRETRDRLLAHLLPASPQDDVAILLARPR